MVTWGWDGREGWTAKGHKNLLGVMEMICILIAVVVSVVHTSVESHEIIHFKWLQFMAHKSYLREVDLK